MPRNSCYSGFVDGGGGGGGSTGKNDGCLYSDEVIMEKGVQFNVRYTGCIEVKTSMKLLDFTTRTQVARECINRVCEAAGLKSASKRRCDKKLQQFIADSPSMLNAGANVIINVSSRALNLINAETGEIMVSHNMPRISFASGGDSDTLDFLAYIAKNEDEWRACYVLECIGGQSEDLIVTIGKAFILRYNALNRKTNQPTENYNQGKENDKDYYNDLPNKLPPDLLTGSELQSHQQRLSQLNLKKARDRLSSNLIDLNSPPPAEQLVGKMNLSQFDPMQNSTSAVSMTGATACAVGVGGDGVDNDGKINAQKTVRDVFDLQPFSISAEVQRSQLQTELWFHSAISRPVAESLLQNDGDFLVRESLGKHNQYVLTGLEGRTPKHLLLIDPEGVVRTKDRIFDNISHLINYHWTNALPIISEDSELVLRNPVIRQQSSTITTTTNALKQKTHHHLDLNS